jgi:DNA-binding NtrC family response regulator
MKSERETSSAVLIIDEEPDILLLLSSILENNGFRTLLARTATEALDIARRGHVPIDLILCNAGIARTTSPDLPTAIRQIRPGLRVVWTSAFVDDGVVRIGVDRMQGSGRVDDGLIAAIHAALRAPAAGVGAAN